jgi:hypothetical protein
MGRAWPAGRRAQDGGRGGRTGQRGPGVRVLLQGLAIADNKPRLCLEGGGGRRSAAGRQVRAEMAGRATPWDASLRARCAPSRALAAVALSATAATAKTTRDCRAVGGGGGRGMRAQRAHATAGQQRMQHRDRNASAASPFASATGACKLPHLSGRPKRAALRAHVAAKSARPRSAVGQHLRDPAHPCRGCAPRPCCPVGCRRTDRL